MTTEDEKAGILKIVITIPAPYAVLVRQSCVRLQLKPSQWAKKIIMDACKAQFDNFVVRK
jgi:hypothetical protein